MCPRWPSTIGWVPAGKLQQLGPGVFFFFWPRKAFLQEVQRVVGNASQPSEREEGDDSDSNSVFPI